MAIGISQVDLASLDQLNQAYRLPGIAPGPVPPRNFVDDGGGDESEGYNVADELIRAIPFVSVEPRQRPFGKQLVVRPDPAAKDFDLDTFVLKSLSAGGGTAWSHGTTRPFGMKLTSAAKRFKKISTVVRADDLMIAGDSDMLDAQVRLASISVVRTLSLGLMQSQADEDDVEFSGLYTAGGWDETYDTGKSMLWNLSRLEINCRPSDGDFGSGPDVFVLSSRARWQLLKELDAGAGADFRECRLTGKIQLHFHGIPVLTGRVNEGVQVAAGNELTTAWALKLFGPSGIRILHVGGDPATFGVRVERTSLVAQTSAAGGPVADVQNATTGVEVFGVYSLHVPETAAVARLNSVPAIAPT